jgi:hypothetical protein
MGREVLAGEGGASGDEVGKCALEDDPAANRGGRRGPRSMIQAACAMTAWWCSITMTELPESTILPPTSTVSAVPRAALRGS